MDGLHLTYDEVVYKIPYRNLVLMQKDKVHVAYGDVIKHKTGKDLAKERREIIKKRKERKR